MVTWDVDDMLVAMPTGKQVSCYSPHRRFNLRYACAAVFVCIKNILALRLRLRNCSSHVILLEFSFSPEQTQAQENENVSIPCVCACVARVNQA